MITNSMLLILLCLLTLILPACDSSQFTNSVSKNYDNLTIRRDIAKKYNQVLPDKQLIAEYYVKNGSLPSTDFFNEKLYENDDFLYNQKTGEIKVFFTAEDSPIVAGKSVTITAILDHPNFIIWSCKGDLPEEVEIQACNQPYHY